VTTHRSASLTRTIADHPWSSLQDALLLFGGMIVALVLALEYDLFKFGSELTTEERTLSLRELIFLSGLLAVGIVAFIVRRLYESRSEAIGRLQRNLEITKLKDQTRRDPLTGILNRRGLLEVLAWAISDLNRGICQHAFFLLDIDEFKRFNDVHGHTVGDQVLKVVVERLRAAVRPADILARLDGGDEFAVLARDVDRDEAGEIGRGLIAALRSEIFAEGATHKISICVGAVMLTEQGMTGGEILNMADLAMLRAKEVDQPPLVFYEDPESPLRR
jgi:diguanylate cyclase (GGDEF)-like protein